MKKYHLDLILIKILLISPSFACAVDAVEDLNYQTDRSVALLVQLFGYLVPVPEGTPIPQNVFSSTLLYLIPIATMLALTMATFTIYFGTIKTSNKGTLFAQGQTGLQTPLRTLAALSLLIPDKYGYPIIQKIFMWFIINGIVVANSLWILLVEQYELTVVLRDNSSLTSSSDDHSKSIDQMIKTLFYKSIQINLDKLNGSYTDAFYDVEENVYDLIVQKTSSTLLEEEANREPVLFKENELSKNGEQLNEFIKLRLGFADIANQILISPLVQDIASNLYDGTDLETYPKTDIKINKGEYNYFYQDFKRQFILLLTEINEDAAKNLTPTKVIKDEGWIVAGSYYWRLQPSIFGEGSSEIIKFDEDNLASSSVLSDIHNIEVQKVWDKIIQTQFNSNSVGQIDPNEVDAGGFFGGFDLSFKPVFESDEDNLLFVFITFCQQKILGLVNWVVGLSIGTLGAAIAATLLSPPGISPTQNVLVTLVFTVLIGVMSIISMAIAPLFIGAFYIPIYPLIIFFAASLGWFMKVIEALIAAPIIAVALTEPTEDEYGRSAQVAFMLLNVTFRPALMIAGLVFAEAMLNIGLNLMGELILMLENENQLMIIGAGNIFWPFLKLSLCITIVQVTAARAFSMIYVLPDKVFSWIGLRPGQGDTKGLMNDFKHGMDDGIKFLEGFFKLGAAIQKSINRR